MSEAKGSRVESSTVAKDAYRNYDSSELQDARQSPVRTRENLQFGGDWQGQTANKDSYRSFDDLEFRNARQSATRRQGELRIANGGHMDMTTMNQVL